jgi:transcriptional regulator with XRE-family HTH domain
MIYQEKERLRIFMEKEGLDQEDLARLIKKNQPTISKYLTGTLRIPPKLILEMHFKYKLNFNWYYAGTGRRKVTELEKKTLLTETTELKGMIMQDTARIDKLEDTVAKLVRDLYSKEK